MRHIWVSKLTTIGSDNGLSPGRRQAIIWTNAGRWSIRNLRAHFSDILSKIHTFSFLKTHLPRPQCFNLRETTSFTPPTKMFRSLAPVRITWQSLNLKCDISPSKCRRMLKFCLLLCNKNWIDLQSCLLWCECDVFPLNFTVNIVVTLF